VEEVDAAVSSAAVLGCEDRNSRLESSPALRKVLLPPWAQLSLEAGVGRGGARRGGALRSGEWCLGIQARALLSLKAEVRREGAGRTRQRTLRPWGWRLGTQGTGEMEVWA
jgi:hypothetical protein